MDKRLLTLALAVPFVAGCHDVAGPNRTAGPSPAASSAPTHVQSWSFSTIDVPGATYTSAHGINDAGDIAGTYNDAAIRSHGFVLRNGQFENPIDVPTSLDPNALHTGPTDINNLGELVGEFSVPGGTRGFFRSAAGAFTLIRYPSSQEVRGLALNDVGEIAGRYRFVDNTAIAFRYSSTDGYQSIGGAAGDPCALPPARCALLPSDFTTSQVTEATGIDNDGVIVGSYSTGSGSSGFRLTHDAFTEFRVPGSDDTWVVGVNDLGETVGTYVDATGQHGFLCRSSCQGAADFVYPIDFPGAAWTVVRDINRHGDIVGNYVDANGRYYGFLGLANHPPTVAADADPVEVDEGLSADNTGTVGDPDGDAVTLSASVGTVTNNGDGTWSWSYPTTDGPAESQTVTIDADDGNGGTAQASFTLTVYNVAPTVEAVTVPGEPVAIGDQPILASGMFSDPAGTADEPYTCTADYDDGSGPQAGTVAGTECTGPDQTYAEAGVYVVTVEVTDKDGGAGSLAGESYLVIYDPSAGFVTGGGWIDSPPGAYVPDPDLTGKANFGFVARYKKGATTPTGKTEFQFKAGDLNFHSSSYEWMVVNQGGSRAQYKGIGTINGGLDPNENEYKFMLWAGDGDPDTFRMKIWWEEVDGTEVVVYDNEDEQAIGGGSITIHTK